MQYHCSGKLGIAQVFKHKLRGFAIDCLMFIGFPGNSLLHVRIKAGSAGTIDLVYELDFQQVGFHYEDLKPLYSWCFTSLQTSY